MIKPVTFQGCFNFDANLYAIEVRSRFIDQTKADGYYRNYGDEIAGRVVGQSIQIGTGAFLVQGRMCEITASETVSPDIYDGFVGYVIAHVETYHPADEENVTLVARVNRTFDAIPLTKDDIYANTADNVNTVYELPLYSFKISGTQITELTRLIQPIEDYATVKKIADDALVKVAEAVKAAEAAAGSASTAAGQAADAAQKASAAQTAAEGAERNAAAALSAAELAAQRAETAVETAQDTANLAASNVNTTNQKVAELERQIGEKQGTTVKAEGAVLAELNFDEVVFVGGTASDGEV